MCMALHIKISVDNLMGRERCVIDIETTRVFLFRFARAYLSALVGRLQYGSTRRLKTFKNKFTIVARRTFIDGSFARRLDFSRNLN